MFDIVAVRCQCYHLSFPQRHLIPSGWLTYCWLPRFWTQLLYVCPLPLHLLLSAEMHHSLLNRSCTPLHWTNICCVSPEEGKGFLRGRSDGLGGEQHTLFLLLTTCLYSLQRPDMMTFISSRFTVADAQTYFHYFSHLFFEQLLALKCLLETDKILGPAVNPNTLRLFLNIAENLSLDVHTWQVWYVYR